MLLFWSFCLFFFQTLFFFCSLCEGEISCLNEDGQPVDWFIIYKLPKYKQGNVGSGVDYMYLDPSLSSWKMSKHAVNTTEGALGKTLNQLYQRYKIADYWCGVAQASALRWIGNLFKVYATSSLRSAGIGSSLPHDIFTGWMQGLTSNSSAYMLYNDAPPVLKYEIIYGHTKGALLFDHFQGFWLTHSIPHFPPFPEMGFDYPSTGKLFGQSVQCTTYSYKQFQKISQQLGYMNPHTYNCSLPLAFYTDMAEMAQICAGKRVTVIPRRRLEMLMSIKGETFISFAKSHSYVDDIYAGWIAQALQTNFLAETWQREPCPLPSNCSLPYHVMNIKSVCLSKQVTFSSYDDHSKWCVSQEYQSRWTCIGDMNRDHKQTWKGGGLICTQNRLVYKAFRSAVAWYKDC